MRILITWGTKEGGTEGIARILGEALTQAGHDVALEPAAKVRGVEGFDAAIVGGSLYAFRWHKDARRFVEQNLQALRRIPVWFFSSGPLDDSADKRQLPAIGEVSVLMQRIGAVGHMTFGGRLTPEAHGTAARAMARKSSGDWRNPERIRGWAHQLDSELGTARPLAPVEPPGRSLGRWIGHGLAGAAISAVAFVALMQAVPRGAAYALHALVAAGVFVGVSFRYFRAPGARQPLPTAALFTVITAALELALGAWALGVPRTLVGTWLPLLLVFLATGITGSILGMMQGARSSGLLPTEPQPRRTATA